MYITMDIIVRGEAIEGLLFSAPISIHLLNDLITLSRRLCCDVSALYEIPTPQLRVGILPNFLYHFLWRS